ncbi:YkgJ family cysteine cluster protein [Candidatus Formimonas warabiya]|uniref:YkgJ family cysteine cluster protein n=1 Tax=Formimonas warabiya TaxID=1761012 RepID=A0A3G1KV67_FORW1|nr:YkgJ family cysteine cluster protein [Candidatus Formimonas warabiya]ATW26332.1 hypothetical protein DCMF_17575 [Candidatus Formimonas warabiya]
MKINVFLAHFDDAVGYDLEILDPEATVQDYLDALNLFQETHVASCRGCDGCCWERIPLTSLDVVKYLAQPEITSRLPGNASPLTSFIHQFCHVWGKGPVVDIMLKQEKNGACVFLDPDEKICRLHPSRSFVCQTFICLPHGERAGQLRDILLNIGEDDLVHRYLREAQEKRETPVIHGDHGASPSLTDYPATPFSEKQAYTEVKIKNVVPEKLWKQLYVHPGF